MGLGIVIQVNGAPDAELAQASQVEVYERLGETTWFSIRYPEDIQSGDMIRSADSRLDPGSVLAILAGPGPVQECLAKGPVCSQQIHLEHGGQGSWLELRGADSSITMDREFKSQVWSNVTDGEAVMSILGNYGLIPDVSTTNTRHLETKHSLVQRETDLRFTSAFGATGASRGSSMMRGPDAGTPRICIRDLAATPHRRSLKRYMRG